jgi:hypothetical protein
MTNYLKMAKVNSIWTLAQLSQFAGKIAFYKNIFISIIFRARFFQGKMVKKI